MKKSVFKNISLSIVGLLGLGVITFGAVSFSEHKKDNINVALAYEGTPLPTSGTLSSGTYYLSSDLTVSSQLKITSGDVIVNLNGHTLNGGGRDKGIFYVTGGTLTVNGKDDETGNRGALNNGGGYYPGSGYSYGGALYITAGAATFSDLDITNCQSNWGGAISMSNSAVTLNNCNLSNNMDTNGYGFYGVIRVGDSSAAGTGLTVNGGEMFSNDGAISVGSNAKATINGAYIHDNEKLGVRDDASEGLKISGNTIIKNNNNSSPRNLVLNNNTVKVGIVSELGNDAYIGVTVSGDTKGVFTNSTDTSLNDASKFFSDDSGYGVDKNDDGQLFLRAVSTVTYSTEYGTAPDPVKVFTGSTIPSEPISPTAEGYVFGGWYKESSFENAWDFATDTVDSDITLYAKWYNPATANVIKLINDIGDLTYDGGVDDSLEDIVAAKTAYDALTDEQKADVDEVYKDILDHDIVVYNHVDNAGDLIKAIPEASNSQDYYNAVEDAKAAYYALTDEEMAILNADPNFNYLKVLNDNVAAKEVIELINDIGDIEYNGGTDDSLDDIEAAEDAYNDLSDDQKALVDLANHDDLEEARETYDEVDDAVNLIASIGNVSHGGASDSQEAIEAAREAYDSLTDEQKALVDSYNDSGKTLKDDEAVYGAMEAIDSIGDVTYSAESEEAIKHAREVYDSLTDDQKDQLGEVYVKILTDAESKYSSLGQKGDILFIVLIIVASLALIGGLVFLYFLIKKKKNKDDDDQNNENLKKGQQTKAYSVGGLVTFITLVSHYLDAKYIVLYVIAFLAIVVWIVCLIMALNIKRKKAIKEEIKPQQVKEIKPQEGNEDEEEVETITDEKGNIFQIRFVKSFTAKLIQSPIETKKYYEELKNEVLSYKGTHSRISWHFDSVNAGRNYILKFAIRGKTLCVYFPLDSEKLEDKYKVEKAETKRYEDVPCLYRIKNDRRCGYAKDLIAMVASNLGLEKGEEQHEVYSNLPYEENKPLIARGLIKELKVKVNKPAEAPVILESKVNSEGDEVVLTKDGSGNLFEIRYVKSFTAKLSQSEEEVKDYYAILKNYVLSYKGVHSRISWHYDAINVSRDYILKFAIRGKTLCVYFALDASKLDKKYKVEEAKGNRYMEVPCLYRIKNDRRCEYAKELIDLLMKEHGLKQGDIPNEDYHIKKESTRSLLDRGLIKEVKSMIH